VHGRITLDELKKYVAPTFTTNPANLPNSVTDMLKGRTDCPLYASYLSSAAAAAAALPTRRS